MISSEKGKQKCFWKRTIFYRFAGCLSMGEPDTESKHYKAGWGGLVVNVILVCSLYRKLSLKVLFETYV